MTLHALPGYIYLKRPGAVGVDDGAASMPSTPEPAHNPFSGPPAPAEPPTEPTPAHPAPRPADIGRLLVLWLEAVDGRRSPQSLKYSPIHPDVISQIPKHHAELRETTRSQVGAVASRIKTLHIQTTTQPTVRFCASALIGKRVRAVAGTTRYVRLNTRKGPPRSQPKGWRIETLQII